MFNLFPYYGSSARGINRFLAPLAEALNDRRDCPLPKYIIYVLDKDLIDCLKGNKIETSIVMGAAIHYLLKQVDILINRRNTDILNIKPGAYSEIYPRIVWIRMLKRPNVKPVNTQKFFSLRRKFNSMLEERLLTAHEERHRIMSIEVQSGEFNNWGDLTSGGKAQFWREVDQAMNKFDTGKIKLFPRDFNAISQQEAKKVEDKPKHKNENTEEPSFVKSALDEHRSLTKRYKLKNPPRRMKRSHSRSKSRGRSCSRRPAHEDRKSPRDRKRRHRDNSRDRRHRHNDRRHSHY